MQRKNLYILQILINFVVLKWWVLKPSFIRNRHNNLTETVLLQTDWQIGEHQILSTNELRKHKDVLLSSEQYYGWTQIVSWIENSLSTL
jgi:hypothetical protein